MFIQIVKEDGRFREEWRFGRMDNKCNLERKDKTDWDEQKLQSRLPNEEVVPESRGI